MHARYDNFLSPGVLPEVRRANGSGVDGYIYVIGFSTGTVKAGRTNNPRGRITSHLIDAEKFGATISNLWLSTRHANYRSNERELLALLGSPSHGNEYFTDIDFKGAVRLAESKLTYETLTDQEREERVSERDARAVAFAKDVLRVPDSPRARIDVGEGIQPWVAYLLFGHEPKLPEWETRVSFDGAVDIVNEMAASAGVSPAEMASWSFIDYLRHLGEQSVRIGVANMKIRALETGRTDLLEPDFYGIADDFGDSTFCDYVGAEPEQIDDHTSILTTVGEINGDERGLLLIENGPRYAKAHLTLTQVDDLILSLQGIREALAMDDESGVA